MGSLAHMMASSFGSNFGQKAPKHERFTKETRKKDESFTKKMLNLYLYYDTIITR